MQQILNEIDKLHLTNVKLLALVTPTYDETVFYATVDGQEYQSNALAETGKIDMRKLDEFYRTVASIVRSSNEFKSDKLNIVKVQNATLQLAYEEKNSKIYAIKKAWKESLLVSKS